MLEDERLGWRSGTRPLPGFASSQKYRNVRAWMSSKRAGSGPGASDGPFLADGQLARKTAAEQAGAVEVSGLEPIRATELEAPLGVHAIGLAEVRVRVGKGRDEPVIPGEVVRVEQVEYLGAHLEGLALAELEQLVQPQVHALVGERPIGPARIQQDLPLVDAAAAAEVGNGVSDAGGELHERAEAQSRRQLVDPGRHDPMPLVSGRGMARVVGYPDVVEAKQVAADLLGSSERVRQLAAPLGLGREGLVDGQGGGVVPGFLGVAREKDVGEVRDVEAAFTILVPVPEDEREPVPAPGSQIGHRGHDLAEGVAEASGELVGQGRPGAVVDEEHLGLAGAAGGDDSVQAGLAEVAVLPDEGGLAVAGGAVRREAERAHGELQAEPLVEPRVVENAVVVSAVAAEEHGLGGPAQIVGKAEARLACAL